MKRIAILWLSMIVILLALSFSTTTNAQPFVSPQLTPPFRPTPTGWPHAPFAWQAEKETRQTSAETRSGIVVEMLPLPTVAPRVATLAQAAGVKSTYRKAGR